VKGQGFARAGIFRPGMLDRGDKARAIEKVCYFAILMCYKCYIWLQRRVYRPCGAVLWHLQAWHAGKGGGQGVRDRQG
jgi:hypothetical protein